MIFERRAYSLRPGRLPEFWEAQRTVNAYDRYGMLSDHNLSYFSTVAGETDQVVHLYRFSSSEFREQCYAQYYKSDPSAYFKLARPWILRQENGLFAASPIGELSSLWTREKPALPFAGATIVTEHTIDFFPGGLAVYWEACKQQPPHAHHMATLSSTVGVLNRVVIYRAYRDLNEVATDEAARANDPAWRAFGESYRDMVAGHRSIILVPSPVAHLRALFQSS